MSIAVEAWIPGDLGGGNGCNTLFFDTEHSMDPHRFVEIGTHRLCQLREAAGLDPLQSSALQEHVASLASSLHVLSPDHPDAMLSELGPDLETFLVHKNIRLLVIDSLAALFRRTFGPDSMALRQDLLMRITARLKWLADKFDLFVVITNHVTAQFQVGQSLRISADSSPASSIKPALGNTWSHCVNTRLAMDGPVEQRRILVVKSPVCGQHSFPFQINEAGIMEAHAMEWAECEDDEEAAALDEEEERGESMEAGQVQKVALANNPSR